LTTSWYFVGERRFEQGIEYLIEMGKDPLEMKWADRFKKGVVDDMMKEEGWRLDEKWEPEGNQPTEASEVGETDGKSVQSTSGLTLAQQGVTPTIVRKIAGERALKWFKARRAREP
jgi:hypothetical protein